MATSRLESAAHIVITIAVGGIGGAVGFRHTHDWAVANGQTGWIAWAVAVVIECMVIVAGLELKRRRGPFPLFVLVAAFLIQMAAQVASAPRTPAGWLIAATPALGFLVIVKLLMRRLADPAPVDQPPDAPVPAAPVAASAQRADQVPAVEHQALAPARVPVDQLGVDEPATLQASTLQASVDQVPELYVPAPRVEVPVTASMTWMQPDVRDRVLVVAREVYAQGRELVPDDLAAVPGLLPATVPALVGELNTAVTR